MSIKARYPSISPTLNLDFANVKALDGRITFTRASSARYYDGKTVALAEQNLFNRSQEFDDAAWFKTNIAVAANTGETTAPDGTSTAEKLTSNAGSAQHYLQRSTGYVSVINGLTYAFSVFVKAGTETVVQLAAGNAPAFGTNAFVNFDLTAGTTGTVGSAASNASIVAVGNGWYRISFTCPAIANDANGNFLLGFTNNNTTAGRITTFNAAGTEDFYAWGAQLEQRDAVTAYTPTTTAPITNYVPVLLSAANNVARFDHNPVTGESLGLLIEEQRTNLLLDSENLAAGDRGSSTGWYSITRSSIVANTLVAPDGTLTADKVVANTDNNTHFAANRTVAGSTTNTNPITFSGYLKAGELTRGSFLITEGSTFSRNSQVYFDLSAGTVTTPSVAGGASAASATITPVGNGWYRCTLTVTLGGTDTRVEVRVYPTNSTSTATFTGDGYGGIYAWGFQTEAGAFPTSYIPTVASQVTRSRDAASMTGANFSSWYNQAEGTLYAEWQKFAPSTFQAVVVASNGTSSNQIAIGHGSISGSNNNLRFDVAAGGVGQASITTISNSPSNTFAKTAAAYAVNDFAVVSNGGAAGTDTSGVLPLVNRLTIGVGGAITGGFLNGTIKKLAYYPLAATSAQLQGLTS